MKAIILVHPSMSVKMTFSIIKSKGYKIFSIITGFESNRIDSNFVKTNSDFLFKGGTNIHEDFDEINKIVSTHKLTICGVINGIDSTVYYADFLAKRYIDEGIELSYSQIRSNKNDVNLCLENGKIATIRGIEMISTNNLDSFKKQLNTLRFPLVGKPTENTAAMSAFRVLYNMADVDLYIQEFFNKKNPYYQDNTIEKVVFQEYIDRLVNKEIVLDFVSYRGKHYCRGIIHYDKEMVKERFPISRFYRALSATPEMTKLINYVKDCLDALKVRNGLTHNEVFFDKDSTVLLIETNNRVAGGGLLELMNAVYGSNPISDYLDLITDKELPAIKSKYNSIAIDVYNHFTDNPADINLFGLNSKTEVLHFRNKRKTVDNYFENYSRVDCVNACLLVSNNSSLNLERDCSIIVQREKEGELFVPAVAHAMTA